ncbi:MAG: pilus assembly FimT family protein [bacterium]
MMNAKVESRYRGFTLTETLVVMSIIAIVLGMGAYALAKKIPERGISTYSRIFLSDMRFAQFKAQAEGQPIVFEVIGYANIPYPGVPTFRLSDTYRIWKMSDWTRYFVNKCGTATPAGGTHKAGFPIPLTVYDVSTGAPQGSGSVLNTGQCDLDGSVPPALGANEVPLPLIEFVHKSHQDPPAVAADPDWRLIRRLPKFERRYKIPDEVDVLVKLPSAPLIPGQCNDAGINNFQYVGYYAIFYPAGGAQGNFYCIPNRVNATGKPGPSVQTLSGGVMGVGLLLSREVALGKNYQVDPTLVGPNRLVPIHAQASRYCSTGRYGKRIEVLLGSGQVSLDDLSPQSFSLSLGTDPNCVLNWNDTTQAAVDNTLPVWK